MPAQPDLFASQPPDPAWQPLAERMRPRTLDEVVGQGHLLGARGLLRQLTLQGQPVSLVLSGPPGTGKTTLARLLASAWKLPAEVLHAQEAGVAQLRALATQAERTRGYERRQTLVFIDEIHRFSRTQQDALLAYVESGLFILVGATTENPSFALTRALTSRCRVVRLHALQAIDVVQCLQLALTDSTRGLGQWAMQAPASWLQSLAQRAQGDVRASLGALQVACTLARGAGRNALNDDDLHEACQSLPLAHDRGGDAHYDVLSALIKSMRAGDEQESVDYLARLMEGGEPGQVVLRRLAIFAAEDVGLADPMALLTAHAAAETFDRVGLPEGLLILTHAVRMLSRAAKDRGNVAAYAQAKEILERYGARPVPSVLRQDRGSGHSKH